MADPKPSLLAAVLDLDGLRAALAKFPTIDFQPIGTENLRERSLQQMVEPPELPKDGRPKGPSSETAYLVAALKRRLAAAGKGAKPTPIAVEIFKAHGLDDAQAKTKADHLVRVLKKTP